MGRTNKAQEWTFDDLGIHPGSILTNISTGISVEVAGLRHVHVPETLWNEGGSLSLLMATRLLEIGSDQILSRWKFEEDVLSTRLKSKAR